MGTEKSRYDLTCDKLPDRKEMSTSQAREIACEAFRFISPNTDRN
jgi:hypothetical protein